MSCWVVPTIAAEIWGVTVDHILQRVRDGNLPHRVDDGFMFVDVAPQGETVERPPTFLALSEAEIAALREGEAEGLDDDAPADTDDEANEPAVDLGDWRAARQRVGVTRVPPAKPQAA